MRHTKALLLAQRILIHSRDRLRMKVYRFIRGVTGIGYSCGRLRTVLCHFYIKTKATIWWLLG